MKPIPLLSATAVALSLLAGCNKADDAVEAPPVATTEAATPSEAETAAAGFDIEKVPVSTVALGDFPHVTLPAGYSNERYGRTDKEFARFPFWIDGKAHWVEGRFHGQTFYAEDGREFSALEVVRNFDALIEQMGGVKVSEGRVPAQEIDTWGDEITQGFIHGLGPVYSDPVRTYLVRREDGNIWLHLAVDARSGGFIVGQECTFRQSAQLLPASELKKQIDAQGKVALQVNFATDKTEVLPDSMPQIEQVATLLKDDPQLRLGVHGHTDASGDAAHNQQLSEGRARAVVALLVERGIDEGRLSAEGFGDRQPVADNTSAEGKAKNRRVELVKR
ncbi:OmpA family protein [Luteimonas sp. e5]